MKKEIQFQTVKVGARGQVVIPLEFRKEMRIKSKESVVAVRVGKKLFYEKMEDFLTDRFTIVLRAGLKKVGWKDIEKQRSKVDRELELEFLEMVK
ncbi:MAG: AbrB/MazE/SpoVT family DNA-binding domain-containing protein [Candidatus Aenigmarchaeota archaeon]|nr:AbrB/MazE/SpoVT family DNA-binding domain-containing protein [Candidatus Aenigmarchaeota archaeon]